MTQPMHRWPPHRNTPTAPRFSTAKRMELQRVADYPMTSRIVIVNGYFVHPTKRRPHKGPAPKELVQVRQPRAMWTPVQACVQCMTNWQRKQWARFQRNMHDEDIKLTDEAELALARAVLATGRREEQPWQSTPA